MAEGLGATGKWVLTWGWVSAVLFAARYPDEADDHIARAESLEGLI
jgi:hypothetical protein